MAPQRRRSDTGTEARATRSKGSEPPAADGAIRTAREAASFALREIMKITEKQPESIIGVEPSRDGWSVRFEVVEDRRIPSSADILATYEAEIDAEGELMSFRRISSYTRGQGHRNGNDNTSGGSAK